MDPQKTHYKISFSATFLKILNSRKLGEQPVYIPPLTPDQPPLKAAIYVINDTGISSSRKLRRVIYYTLYRMDPRKAHYKISFSATFINIHKFLKLGGKSVYIPPLTPDQPPFKGGYLC